ncbi:hypothetical protein HW561_21535 [Rhodobacteraceae bacterium B1Z28]|uniref:Spondin domain-containing protein n=1 Tax=Ruegeria haliotis TaxID=2747601 RepID=A0ABX2PZC8_9RHOB|nr:hypothetical protein [Ruegeria haliotis]NVO58369.1 hypothetical protein [Ruegeria haliotis]
MRPFPLTSVAVLAVTMATQSNAQDDIKVSYDAAESMSLTFIFHIDDGMAEQDVFYEKVPGSGEVFRPTAATRDMDVPLYAPGIEVKHNFLDTSDTGPYPKGRPLGLTLGDWFAAKGSGTYTCSNGVGTVDLAFENLVPGGVYTIWHDFMVWPPTDPFIGTYDLPFGARDGSENTFVANGDGSADFERTISPCLQLSGEHLAADLGLAWHSDGQTYGPLPGEFSTVTHVQMYVALPERTGL